MSSPFDTELYRVYSLVDKHYNSRPVNTIDFTLHLQHDKILHKHVEKGANGRPVKACYFDSDENLIAVITFEFVVDEASKLVSEKKLFLQYVKAGEDDSDLSESILIKHQKFDFTNLADLEASMRELEEARHSIIATMKGFLVGVIQFHLSKSSMEVVQLIKPFWDAHKTMRDDFVELGDEEFRDTIAAMDPVAEGYDEWMLLPINAELITIQQYIVSSLTY